MLLRCRGVFEQQSAALELGLVFGQLGVLEHLLGNNEAALRFERTAIRYNYAYGDTGSIQASHCNLAVCMERNWRGVLGHQLAAITISGVTGAARLRYYVEAFADDLNRADDEASTALPSDFATLCSTVHEVEGVRFRELVTGLQPDSEVLNRFLQDVIVAAKNLAGGKEIATHSDD